MKSNWWLPSLVLATVSTLHLGCGAFDDAVGRGKKSSKKAREIVRLSGQWEGPCKEVTVGDLFSVKEELDFTLAKGFTQTTVYHTDGSCKEEAAHHIVTGSYELINPRRDGVNDIDYTVEKVEVKPDSGAAADILNTLDYCGKSNFKKGQAKDVTGDLCLSRQYKEGEKVYDLVEVNDDKLFRGDAMIIFADKDRPEDRPTDLDKDNTFTRR